VRPGETLAVPPQAGPADRTRLKAMRQLVSEAAEGLGLEPTVLATKRDFEALLFAGEDDALDAAIAELRRGSVVAQDLAVHPVLAHAARDELRVL